MSGTPLRSEDLEEAGRLRRLPNRLKQIEAGVEGGSGALEVGRQLLRPFRPSGLRALAADEEHEDVVAAQKPVGEVARRGVRSIPSELGVALALREPHYQPARVPGTLTSREFQRNLN